MPADVRLPSVLRLVNPVAERAIVVGDPGRALELAQALTTGPLMCNHQRGLWGYTGTAADGRPLTVQSTGTGGPSVAAVVRELAGAGVRRMVRAGSGLALTGREAEGDARDAVAIHPVAFALAADGTSRALGHDPATALRPDPDLAHALNDAARPSIGVLSVDLLPQHGGPPLDPPADVVVVDRQTAAFLAASAAAGVRAAAVLALPTAADDDEDERSAWWRALGAHAARALVPAAARAVATPSA